VARHYSELAPELTDSFVEIPHGVRRFESGPLELDYTNGRRLRVVILGSLAPQKGLQMLRGIQAKLRSFCDLYLVGCGEYGMEFEALSHITAIPEYDWHELPTMLSSIGPDLGLLLSLVPETFSYTLRELMSLAIPPVVTRMGSFEDWIEDGVNGFLCDAEPGEVLARLEQLNGQRYLLEGVHLRLRGITQRSVAEMVAEYERVLHLPTLSRHAYFNRGDPQMKPAIAELAAPAAKQPLAQVRNSAQRLLERLAKTQARVDELEQSLSWRITAPLRWVGARALKWRRQRPRG
jgi:glycosyltransferase involved in cell wall biosynthesis